MKRTWTIIGVSDVAGSFKWHQSLFGHPETALAHDDFGQIVDTNGTALLCLHQWGAHEHPSLRSPLEASPGNGLLLFFRVDDFDPALKRARALVARFEEEPHVNPNTGVLAPGSGRILCHDQCAACRGLTAAGRTAMFERLFGKSKPSQQVDKLIHRIADHHRSADYSELYKLLPGVKLYFPVSPSAIQGLPRGQPIKVPKDSDFRLQKAVVKGRTLAVLYTSSSDRRLGPHYVEIEGAEALRMAMRIPDIDGLLIQSAGTAWVGIEKEQIANLLGTAA